MALKFDDNKIFYHIPKTGGNYVRKVIGTGLEVGHNHATPLDHPELVSLQSFTVVRNPMDWYRSYYRYRIKKGWKKNHFIDKHTQASSFAEFIEKMLTAYPCGYVTSQYLTRVPFVDHVLRTETLTDDLKKLFKIWEIPFNDVPPTNVTSKDIDTSLPPQLEARLLNSERRIINYLKNIS